ncbi:hypothetical protein ACFVAJ_10150 [Agromyces sp. NPDC057679]|uniref:hypothetical protein n=1 Tax=Agromyces sp. NPDC057679 TaxID=3346207 RepID=UPI0036711B40
MHASPDPRSSISVLRLESSELDEIEADAANAGDDSAAGRYVALLAAPSGIAACRRARLAGGAFPPDVVVVQYRDGAEAYTRAWVRHGQVGDAVAYSFFTETPAPFPSRSYPIAAIQPWESGS